MMKRIYFLLLLCLTTVFSWAQALHFAHITDTHIGGTNAAEDLERTVDDINRQDSLDFVILSGDITEFGSDDELELAKRILDKLTKPWYIVPGNHDSKWSESGNNSFVEVFGCEEFAFEQGGYLFIGTASGPNMRMAPGLVPREQVVFLDSVLTNMARPDQPIISINHYPLNESLSNWHVLIDKFKTRNIQATLLGHGHQNKLYNFEGIPGVMSRSNLRAQSDTGGYNIATITRDTLFYAERTPGGKTHPVWCWVPLQNHYFSKDTTSYPRPDYMSNQQLSRVKSRWEIQDDSDIGTGLSRSENYAVYGTTSGKIVARDIRNGKLIWSFSTGGKVYSTPDIAQNRVVCASTDQKIYCLNLKTGKQEWAFSTGKGIVASPAIDGKSVFIGSSEGVFRSIDLMTGELNWQFDQVRNFVECRPLVYQNRVYFGSWGNTFYALDALTGKLIWKREKYTNRMLSPAVVWPVAANNKIFIVAPDRRMTALNAETGEEIWDSGEYSCRESIGISEDGQWVYIKSMYEGNVNAFYTAADTQELAWECQADLGYEIAPSPITEDGNVVFVPTTEGVVCAIDKTSHQVLWKYKVSHALINHVLPVGKNRVLVSVLDGKVACLEYD
ncbi:PQQ-binding-like beta-propeller repeat protein [Sunxiuqinia rutila]|uniref:outer membrane protein assembly factor BamB family protein n=1 Tax=Sunxiuqinia rutila TaxID=1397841 RepID=UPI003D35A8F7